MSKKMIKRSLALGALMAFVITGSAMAAESIGFDAFVGSTAKNGTIEVMENTTVDRGTTTNKILGDYTLNVKDNVSLVLNNIKKGTSGINITGNGNIFVNVDKTVSGYDGAGVSINGDITAKTLTINADNPNGRNDKGIAAGYGSDITITATDSVNITSGDIGIHTEGDGTPKTTVTINTKDLMITSTERSAILNSYTNDVIVNATGNVVMNSAHGLYHSGSGKTVVTGQNIDMTSTSYGVYATYAKEATVEIKATDNLTIVSGGEIATTSEDSKIVLSAGKDAKITCDVSAEDGSISVDAGTTIITGDVGTSNKLAEIAIETTDSTTINGSVTVKQGEIGIYADNNVTVTGAVNATGGEGVEDTAYVSIEAKNDVVIKDGVGVLFAKGSEATGRTEGLRIAGNNVTINTTNGHNALYNGGGETKFIAKNELNIGGVNGFVNEGGSINANADKINITATPSGADGGYAVIAMNGETVITPNEGGSANIIGDILVDNYYPNNTPKIDVVLGDAGSLKGAVVNEYGNTEGFGVKLDLGTDSTWTVTGESNVTTLSGNSGKLVVSDTTPGLVTIGTDSIGSLTVATVTEDGNTDETLSALSKVVTTNDGSAVADKVQLKNAIYDNVTADVNGLGDVTVNEGSKEIAEANIAANDMAAVGLMSWRAEMNDMNKRMGELRNANGEHGVWVRMVRGESEYNSVKNQYNQYQLGYDEKLSVDKRWTVGAAISYTDAENNFAQGKGESTNKALSIYGSKLNADGTFVDLIAKYARLENEFDIVSGMGDAEYDANGYSFSAEFGKRIQQGNGLWIEPQVELTYGKVGSADYVTAKGVKVAQDSMESLVGRVGFSLGKDIKDGNVYARASYLYDFEGETQATLNNDAVLKQDLGGGWWEVGVGANINLSKATYIYADVEKTFGGEVDTNWQWNLGVRYSF